MHQIPSVISRAAIILLCFAAFPSLTSAQSRDNDLSAVSLENLMNLQVTSVSRREEELRSTAAAVYVITREDIRRSGLTDVAELLRLVPGMNVARITSNTWAIGARGFNAQYATKLLVQVDGRTVYDPDFSGVYWNTQNLVLEDIEKIEVIRGPGATMWGANAVNGVINITTKRASETVGGLFTADAGSNRPGEGSFRYGAALGKDAFFRVFGRQTTRSTSRTESGDPVGDAWNMTSAGFRFDWHVSPKDEVTVEGDIYRGVTGDPRPILASVWPITYKTETLDPSGGNVLSRWTRSLGNSSNLAVQFYYDRRNIHGYDQKRVDIIDFDLQHDFAAGRRHKVIWGFGFRENDSNIDNSHNSIAFGINPARQKTSLTSVFVQDEIEIVPGVLSLTAGTKVEHSTLTHYNVQPTVRVSWTPNVRHSAWASASHAVRTANRVERGLYVNFAAFEAGPTTGLVSLYGQPNTRSEGLMAYEAGYRYQANRRLWFDTATFYNVYDHLSTVEPGTPFFETTPQPHLVNPLYFENAMKGETYGGEIAGNYKINELLAVQTSYSFLRMALHGYNGPVSTETVEDQNPRHQVHAGTFVNLPRSFEVSAHAYFVGALKAYQVPSYTRLDLNVAWKRFENVEFSVAGQNLFGKHAEFGDLFGPTKSVNRSVYGKVAWRF